MQSKKTIKSNWKRNWQAKLTNKEKSACRKIEKAEKTKNQKGLTTLEITKLLSNTRHFLGVYAEDELMSLTIGSYPTFLVVNIDKISQPGSHWLAIGIFKRSIEIFDSVGFKIFLWSRVPCGLLTFLHKLSIGRTIRVSNRLQSRRSHLCGFYAMYYILARNCMSFTDLCKIFSSNFIRNDQNIKNVF